MLLDVVKGFVLLFLIFVPLERVFTLHSQRILRSQWKTDLLYYVTGFFIGRAGLALCTFTAALLMVGHSVSTDLQEWVAMQPIVAQLAAAIVIGDFGYYTAHRLLHTVPWLWQFHAVHHSVEEMDWLAAVRVHPVDQLLTKFFQIVPLFLLGFSTQTLALYALFSAAIAFYIHANIRLTVGPLKWVIVTPEFHRWHHANEPGVRNKNLSVQTPLMDLLFGTFYLPPGKRPRQLGNPYPIPSGYLPQFLHPFQQLTTRSRRSAAMTQPQAKRRKPLYLRPLPLTLALMLMAGAGTVGIAKANNISVSSMVYVFFAGFNTPKVTLADLQAQKVKPVVLVDVRDADEYRQDHIGNSISVPLDDIQHKDGVRKVQQIANTYAQPNQPKPTIVLYCSAGPRSIKAYHALKQQAIEANLTVLSGGIYHWRETVKPAGDEAVLSPIAAVARSPQSNPQKSDAAAHLSTQATVSPK
jgi:sterol desaturase/sphingolipid hydroxylase (fatty acid hydroxylase superfamily)/rhodanese-related sulfurtransferase